MNRGAAGGRGRVAGVGVQEGRKGGFGVERLLRKPKVRRHRTSLMSENPVLMAK